MNPGYASSRPRHITFHVSIQTPLIHALRAQLLGNPSPDSPAFILSSQHFCLLPSPSCLHTRQPPHPLHRALDTASDLLLFPPGLSSLSQMLSFSVVPSLPPLPLLRTSPAVPCAHVCTPSFLSVATPISQPYITSILSSGTKKLALHSRSIDANTSPPPIIPEALLATSICSLSAWS